MKSILDCKQRLHFIGGNAHVSMYVDSNTDYILPDFYKREIIVDEDVRCAYIHTNDTVSINVACSKKNAYVTIPLKANVDTYTKHTSSELLHLFLVVKEFYLEGTPCEFQVNYTEASTNTVNFKIMKQLTLSVGCRNVLTVYTEIVKAKPAFVSKRGVVKKRSNMIAFPASSQLSKFIKGKRMGKHYVSKSGVTYQLLGSNSTEVLASNFVVV